MSLPKSAKLTGPLVQMLPLPVLGCFIAPIVAFPDTLPRADNVLTAKQLLLSPTTVTVECSLSILEDEYAAHDDQITVDDDSRLELTYAVCTATDGTTYDIEDSPLVKEEGTSGDIYTLTLQPSHDAHGHHLFKVVAAVKAGGARDHVVSVTAEAASNAVLGTASNPPLPATSSSPASVAISVLTMKIEFLDTLSCAKADDLLEEDFDHIANLYCARWCFKPGATSAPAHRRHVSAAIAGTDRRSATADCLRTCSPGRQHNRGQVRV